MDLAFWQELTDACFGLLAVFGLLFVSGFSIGCSSWGVLGFSRARKK